MRRLKRLPNRNTQIGCLVPIHDQFGSWDAQINASFIRAAFPVMMDWTFEDNATFLKAMVHGHQFGGFVLDVVFHGFWKGEIFGGEMKGKLQRFLLATGQQVYRISGRPEQSFSVPALERGMRD